MMIPTGDWLLFTGAALLMVLTPGPNMVYLLSRSVCQGRRAGFVSLFGVVAGFLVPVPLLVLHVIEGLIQAYIFGMLALIYIAGAIQSQQLRQSEKRDDHA